MSMSSRSLGRGRLPQWVVRIRSVLRCIVSLLLGHRARARLAILEKAVRRWMPRLADACRPAGECLDVPPPLLRLRAAVVRYVKVNYGANGRQCPSACAAGACHEPQTYLTSR